MSIGYPRNRPLIMSDPNGTDSKIGISACGKDDLPAVQILKEPPQAAIDRFNLMMLSGESNETTWRWGEEGMYTIKSGREATERELNKRKRPKKGNCDSGSRGCSPRP